MKTMEELKKEAVEFATTMCGKTEMSFPYAALFSRPEGAEQDSVDILALALPPRQMPMVIGKMAVDLRAYAGFFIMEAWVSSIEGVEPRLAADKRDAVCITIDHPEGIMVGKALVTEGQTPRFGEFAWVAAVNNIVEGRLTSLIPREGYEEFIAKAMGIKIVRRQPTPNHERQLNNDRSRTTDVAARQANSSPRCATQMQGLREHKPAARQSQRGQPPRTQHVGQCHRRREGSPDQCRHHHRRH